MLPNNFCAIAYPPFSSHMFNSKNRGNVAIGTLDERGIGRRRNVGGGITNFR